MAMQNFSAVFGPVFATGVVVQGLTGRFICLLALRQIMVIHISATPQCAHYLIFLPPIWAQSRLVGIFHYLTTFTIICSNAMITQVS